MKDRGNVFAAVGAVVLLAAGIVVASNQGFRLNYTLTGPGAAPINGTNTIGLPFNQSLATAADLAADIDAASPGSVISIQAYDKTINDLQTFLPGDPDPFALVAGEGYRVTVNTDVNYVIYGSHNPGLAINLTAGTNTYAYPYHSVASTAADLAAEIDGAVPGTVVSIQRYDKATDALQAYVPDGISLTGFNLTPGESYRISVAQPVSFVPAVKH